KESNNIDIIYNSPESNSLQVIYGQELTNISIPDNFPEIYENWTEIKFDTPDTSLVDTEIDFDGKVKILFGANDFTPFKTNDVPTMNIKDIRIYEKGKCLHHLPLDESVGNFADDLISKKKASVQNPFWIKPGYHDWDKFVFTILHGSAAITFDSRDEKVYMIGDEQMKIFSVFDTVITTLVYNEEFEGLEAGSHVFFDSIRNTLFCYNLKFRTVYYFDIATHVWRTVSLGPRTTTALWFHNKYYSHPDSTLYIFGGYGQHMYSNKVQRYEFISNRWDTLLTGGDIFHPRQHAALGNFEDTIYILGGFGSISGQQILKPQHYNDLMAFSLKDKKFIKKYEYQAPLEDIDFAHSMVLDIEDQSYYVLASTIFEYETYLQLLKGNLTDPELEMLGNQIPYIFHNENSYSDLFFSITSQKLIAATLLADLEKDETEINVYTISFPPHLSEIETTEVIALSGKLIWGILLFLFVGTLIAFLLWYYRKKGSPGGIPESGIEKDESRAERPSQNTIPEEKRKKSGNSILFFGGFQIFNKDGDDITNKFTPLLKELFLLIFLHSIRDKGISVQRLTELLWFSMDDKSAKNNRAVNIAKLKNLLIEVDSCELSRKTGYWQIVFNDAILYNDYWTLLKIFKQQKLLSKEQLEQFLSIIKMGALLGNASYEWLDEFKSACSNLIIDTLIHYADQSNLENDPDIIIRLADAILIFDILHEEAIGLKCKALIVVGKHSLAKNTFTKFSKDYLALYDEPYDKSFSDIIKSENNS
ncbi:hypothetical protein ACFLTU_05630, partial [Bacteroidota bacterium]